MPFLDQPALVPIRRVAGDDIGKVAAPALDQRAVGFKMELDSVNGAADAEGLDLGVVALGEAVGMRRQGYGVGVPMELGCTGAERADDRVAPPGRRGPT
jgi:hypothetical protein